MFQDGAIQLRTPRRGFLDTTAGKALIMGVASVGIIVMIGTLYYIWKAHAEPRLFGAKPPDDMNPIID